MNRREEPSLKVEAVVFTERNHVDFALVEVPALGPDDVWVKTEYSWISNGTEASFLRGDRVDGIKPWSPGEKLPFPLVPGYQKVGVITELGSRVKHLKQGQRVFVTKTKVLGMHMSFAGHIAEGPAAAKDVYPLPETDSPEQYSGLVLTQVGWNSGMRGDVPVGSKAVVVGDGLIGHWAAQTLQARGAEVALVGKYPERLKHFAVREAGLTLTYDSQGDWFDHLLSWAEGELHIAVDTVGSDVNHAVNDRLLGMLAWGGHFVATGHHGHHALIDMRKLTRSELTLHCPCGWTDHRLLETMRWIEEGKLDTLGLISHRLPAYQAAEAWDLILHHRAETRGIILTWN